MGYPRKSYPHRCSPPCAKRSRPRACARVYIIYRSPVGRSQECPRRCGEEVAPPSAGWGRAKAIPAPARAFSPRRLVYGRALCPLMGESQCATGEGEGKGGRPLAQQPALARLPPRPRRLNGHPASAGGRENDRMAHRRTTTPTHRTQRGNDTCTIRVPRRKGAQSVVHNL